MNLYALTKDYQNAFNNLMDNIDGDTGEVNPDALIKLDIADKAFEEKALNYAAFIRAIEGRKTELETEIDRMTAIKKKLDNLSERLRNSLSQACLTTGKTKLNGLHANIAFRKSEKVIIEDEQEIPDEYKKVKTTFTVDKTAIKYALKNGIPVSGARMEECENIQIK